MKTVAPHTSKHHPYIIFVGNYGWFVNPLRQNQYALYEIETTEAQLTRETAFY